MLTGERPELWSAVGPGLEFLRFSKGHIARLAGHTASGLPFSPLVSGSLMIRVQLDQSKKVAAMGTEIPQVQARLAEAK